ncbi:DUF4097 family beta strand repeat-containing protein [Streptomyces abikoensis]
MATYDTPGPISVRIEISAGTITLRASRRTDTVVEVRPADGADAEDAKAAGQARVDFGQGKLQVKAAQQALHWPGAPRRTGAVDVLIDLPEGSDLRGTASSVTLRGEGRLGECRFEAAHGDIRLDEAGPLRLSTRRGEIAVRRAVGHTRIANGTGGVRIGEIDGSALVGNDHGETRIGDAAGPLRLTGMNGDFHVERAHGGVDVKTAHGSVRLGEIVRGAVAVAASSARIEIGIRQGTAAKLDVSTLTGTVRNTLAVADGPGKAEETAEVKVRTYSGDVVIRRP